MSNTSKIVVAACLGFIAGAATMFVVGAMLAFLTLQYTVPQSPPVPEQPLPDASELVNRPGMVAIHSGWLKQEDYNTILRLIAESQDPKLKQKQLAGMVLSRPGERNIAPIEVTVLVNGGKDSTDWQTVQVMGPYAGHPWRIVAVHRDDHELALRWLHIPLGDPTH